MIKIPLSNCLCIRLYGWTINRSSSVIAITVIHMLLPSSYHFSSFVGFLRTWLEHLNHIQHTLICVWVNDIFTINVSAAPILESVCKCVYDNTERLFHRMWYYQRWQPHTLLGTHAFRIRDVGNIGNIPAEIKLRAKCPNAYTRQNALHGLCRMMSNDPSVNRYKHVYIY